MTNFIPSLYTCLIVLVILAFINVGQQMHTNNPTMTAADMQNFSNATEKMWVNASATIMAARKDIVNASPIEIRLYNVIYKGVDTFGYIAVQVMNTGVEYGFQNPDFQAKNASDALIALIVLEIVVVIAMPVCAVVYGLYLLAVWINSKVVVAIVGKTKSKSGVFND